METWIAFELPSFDNFVGCKRSHS